MNRHSLQADARKLDTIRTSLIFKKLAAKLAADLADAEGGTIEDWAECASDILITGDANLIGLLGSLYTGDATRSSVAALLDCEYDDDSRTVQLFLAGYITTLALVKW